MRYYDIRAGTRRGRSSVRMMKREAIEFESSDGSGDDLVSYSGHGRCANASAADPTLSPHQYALAGTKIQNPRPTWFRLHRSVLAHAGLKPSPSNPEFVKTIGITVVNGCDAGDVVKIGRSDRMFRRT